MTTLVRRMSHFPYRREEDYLDGSEYDASVRMLKLRHDSLTNVFALLLVLRIVPTQGVKDRDASPFRTFIQRHQESVQDYGSDLECI